MLASPLDLIQKSFLGVCDRIGALLKRAGATRAPGASGATAATAATGATGATGVSGPSGATGAVCQVNSDCQSASFSF